MELRDTSVILKIISIFRKVLQLKIGYSFLFSYKAYQNRIKKSNSKVALYIIRLILLLIIWCLLELISSSKKICKIVITIIDATN